MKIQNMLQTILEYKTIAIALCYSLLKVIRIKKNLLTLGKEIFPIKIKYYEKIIVITSVIKRTYKLEEIKNILDIFKLENITKKLAFKNGDIYLKLKKLR